MRVGQLVQVRRFDGSDHWIFARVQDPSTRRVQVEHAGNPADGQALIPAAGDLRTREDVQSILAAVQAAPRGRLSDQAIRILGKLDGWLLQYLEPHASLVREQLHTVIVPHYQAILKALG
jgi:hypothetical protein